MLLRKHKYVAKPTGADSPSQNGAVGSYNGKLAVRTWTLLFGSGLPAKYWSSALIHSVYLHSQLVHTVTRKTPFEAYFGVKPDLSCLKLFGSRVCVKRSGSRHSKLDRHDFKGIFLGYTVTDQNIVYLDLDSGVVKLSHHAQFDEAWYLQSSRPPAAQLLYDLGLLPEDDPVQDPASVDNALRETYTSPGTVSPVVVPWPPLAPANECTEKWTAPVSSRHLHLPLRVLTKDNHHPTTARAARVTPLSCRNLAAELMEDYKIGVQDMSMIYMSPDPYHEAFEQTVDLRKFDLLKHKTAGLSLYKRNGRVHLASISPSTPAAPIHNWRTCIHGAWLIKVDDTLVTSIDDVSTALEALRTTLSPLTTLLFSHPEIQPNLSQDGIPIVSSAPFLQHTHDQLNNQWEFTTVAEH
jgi:hypothetical protein